MSLRPYQQEALQATVDERNAGAWAQLIVLPTGTGKAVLAANLLRYHPLKAREKLLLFVHRDELVRQAAEKFRRYNPLLRVGMHTGDSEAPADCDVVVASVQTIGRMTAAGHTRRLTKFHPDWFRVVFIDEAHHALAASYKNVLRYCGVLKGDKVDDSKLLVGLTATPRRTDSVGLEAVFQKIVYSRSIREMVNEKWLARPRGAVIHTEADISGVKTKKDDFVPGQLAEAVNTPERNDLIVRDYIANGEGFPAIGFTVDVKHAHDLAERFHAHGITAFPVSGSTPQADRRAAFGAFEAGRCRVLTSCDTLTEGLDKPMATVALMARPVKSELVFTQMLGRVLRPYPSPEDRSVGNIPSWEKPYAIVRDYVDACGRHSLSNIATLFGLRQEFNMGGGDVIQTVEEIEKVQLEQPKLDLKECRDIIQVRSSVREIDLLREVVVPPVVRSSSRFEWQQDGAGDYHLSLPDKGSLLITMSSLGYREVYKCKNGVRLKHATARNLADALKIADALIPNKLAQQMGTDANWDAKKPTSRQIMFLWQLDKDLRKKWPTVGNKPGWHVLYEYAVEQYGMGRMAWSRPALGGRIGRFTATRDLRTAGFTVKEA